MSVPSSGEYNNVIPRSRMLAIIYINNNMYIMSFIVFIKSKQTFSLVFCARMTLKINEIYAEELIVKFKF